ncbi:MAG: hypothetical protein JNK74_22605 [Candidatus Hydrogenedentes bacterium]|nr:hypothetical protein [Candidatus Hydrogenedentota bacterium]
MSQPTRRTVLKLGVASLPAAAFLAQPKALAAPTSPLAGPDAIEKASVCFRIGQPIWANEARFNELLDLFDAHRGVTDEVTLFTSETHPPLPLDVMLARMTVLQARMVSARARGYRSGVNILATIGHHEENLPNSLQGDFTPATDPNGNVCRGSICPNDPALHAYAVKVYQALPSTQPDYIWIDDDVRLFGHSPVRATCFCDRCVGIFSKQVRTSYTRDSLREAFGAGTLEERLQLRRAFLQHNRDTLSRLFALIEGTVHKAAPGMPLGFMTGDRFYEGYDFDTWAEVLAGPSHSPVLWRPGGGAYREDRLDDFPDKAHAMGRQVALLPQHVRVIQSEVESFPYQRLKKSIHTTAMEAAAYIAAGCTGTAFNVLSMYDEPLDEYAPLVAGLKEARPFLDLLAAHQGRVAPTGLHSGWVKDTYAASNPDGPWLGDPGSPNYCNELWATGLPAAYAAEHAAVTALSGDGVLALSANQIESALAGGLYIDGPALTRLNDLGYGELTGFAVDKVEHIDCIEELTSHVLNGDYAGRRRNGRQSFYKSPASLLRPTAEGTISLSRIVDYTYNEIAPCCTGLFENKLGGRICVAGYYPWEQMQNLSKSSQLKAVMQWLSKDTLAAHIASFHRINLWVRETAPDRFAIALLNAYGDPAEAIEIIVRTQQPTLTFYDNHGTQSAVAASATQSGESRFTLPTIEPWGMAFLSI